MNIDIENILAELHFNTLTIFGDIESANIYQDHIINSEELLSIKECKEISLTYTNDNIELIFNKDDPLILYTGFIPIIYISPTGGKRCTTTNVAVFIPYDDKTRDLINYRGKLTFENVKVLDACIYNIAIKVII